jgi:hypothetical protein
VLVGYHRCIGRSRHVYPSTLVIYTVVSHADGYDGRIGCQNHCHPCATLESHYIPNCGLRFLSNSVVVFTSSPTILLRSLKLAHRLILSEVAGRWSSNTFGKIYSKNIIVLHALILGRALRHDLFFLYLFFLSCAFLRNVIAQDISFPIVFHSHVSHFSHTYAHKKNNYCYLFTALLATVQKQYKGLPGDCSPAGRLRANSVFKFSGVSMPWA